MYNHLTDGDFFRFTSNLQMESQSQLTLSHSFDRQLKLREWINQTILIIYHSSKLPTLYEKVI